MLEVIKNDKCFKKSKFLKRFSIDEKALDLCHSMLVVENSENRISPEMMIENKFLQENIILVNKEKFTSLLSYEWVDIEILKYKISNLKSMHNIIFYLIFNLKDYFLEVEELILLTQFYNYFDSNHDGYIKRSEFEETFEKVIKDIPKDIYINYIEIFEAIVNNDFRLSEFGGRNKDTYTYEYFITANIILKMYAERESFNVKRRINIMFKELDTDKSNTISIEEIQEVFKNVAKGNYIKESMRIMLGENMYDGKFVTNFDEMELKHVENFLLYECVRLKEEQWNKIKEKFGLAEDLTLSQYFEQKKIKK
jgi:Ca2+-binding EF-hand superfamily protein